MATKNKTLSQLNGEKTYTDIIFKRVWRRVADYQAHHPEKKIVMMAFGDTSQPLPSSAVEGLITAAHHLEHAESYTGYEDVCGNPQLRQAICTQYYHEKYDIDLDADEVFISDGAQSAGVNLQELFSPDSVIAIQNPAYPSFTEASLLANRIIVDLPCDERNGFIPHPPMQKVDLIYLCFPNNPTGAVANWAQLQAFVDYARQHQAVIIFDAVYSAFISSASVPHSIYQLEGAKDCAIEIGSFSKTANFTGLRVGWCTIPQRLTINDTVQGELNQLWRTRHGIKFWGTANVAQHAARATLSITGQKECQQIVDYYKTNAMLLQQGLEAYRLRCFGARNSPYVWLKASAGLSSWEFFEQLLQTTGIVGVPGTIFGSHGEGYLRLSALGQREAILEAIAHAKHFSIEI